VLPALVPLNSIGDTASAQHLALYSDVSSENQSEQFMSDRTTISKRHRC
jgi:hypothetical protein